MRNKKGQFVKGERASVETEFKPGQHWRPAQLFRDKEWLHQEYIVKQRSTGDIASQFNVSDASILFWLRKHNIPRRSVKEAREIKHWGLEKGKNPMYGRFGASNPRWRGGITADRQAFYSSQEWAEIVKQVWQRDKATCQRCKARANGGPAFHIHHIVSFEVKELRADITNLILLCGDCHRWVHSKANVNRDFIKEKGGQ